MYTVVKTRSAQRITEVREYLDFLVPLIPDAPTATPRHLNTAKGLIFVQLYGVVEFTICATVAQAIDAINGEMIPIQDLQPFMWGLALNAELDSLNQANRNKWDKRVKLFDTVVRNEKVDIRNDIMPTNGKNYTSSQLESIWKTFCISAPIFDDLTFRGRLQEIVGNRINIAHGNSSAAEVGSRVTAADLRGRIDDVSQFCSYFISVFEDYCLNQRYRR